VEGTIQLASAAIFAKVEIELVKDVSDSKIIGDHNSV
jgi:hypothetical protein